MAGFESWRKQRSLFLVRSHWLGWVFFGGGGGEEGERVPSTILVAFLEHFTPNFNCQKLEVKRLDETHGFWVKRVNATSVLGHNP